MTPTIGALPEDWDDPMTTPDTLAAALDALRWRDLTDEPRMPRNMLMEWSVERKCCIGRTHPTPAGDAAIAAELERLRAEVERLRALIAEHNAEALHVCGLRDERGDCRRFEQVGSRCADCPRGWLIDDALRAAPPAAPATTTNEEA